MKKLTFIVVISTSVKGPYTLAQLREMWSEGKINADTKPFLTKRDEADKVKCFSLRAADIKENLEGLMARVTAL